MVNPIDDIVCRASVSGTVIDSIMMDILASLQDFEVGCLKDKLVFVEQEMQKLEWCLRMKQVALDEDMVSLMDSNDGVWGRLEDAELLILRKNKELAAAMDREGSLRESMEIKDKEISSLMALLELSNSDDSSEDNPENGDLEKLKEEVNLQLGSIRCEVEVERIRLIEGMKEIFHSQTESTGFTNVTSEISSDYDMLTNKNSSFIPYEASIGGMIELPDDVLWRTNLHDQNPVSQNYLLIDFQKVFFQLSEINMVFKQMLDVLQRTLDLLFLKIRRVISRTDTDTLDQPWEHVLQSQVFSIVLQCFICDLLKVSESKCKTPNGHIELTSHRWLLAKEAISCVRDELNDWVNQHEEQSTYDVILRTRSSPSPSLESTPNTKKDQQEMFLKENHVSGKTCVDALSRNKDCVVPRFLPKKEEMDTTDKFTEKGQLGSPVQSPSQRFTSVAAMIRNHESIIRRKMEEIHRYKGDPPKDKGSSLLRTEILSDATKKRILKAALKLDSIIMDTPQNVLLKQKLVGTQSLGTSDSTFMDFLSIEESLKMEQLQYDIEEYNMKSMIQEQVFALILLEHCKQLNLHLQEHTILSIMKDDIVGLVVADMLVPLNGDNYLATEMTSSKTNYVEGINIHSNRKTSKKIREQQEVCEDSDSQDRVMKDVLLLLLREYIKDLYSYIDDEFASSLLRNDIFRFILVKTFMLANHENNYCIIQEFNETIQDGIFSSKMNHSKQQYGACQFHPEGDNVKHIHKEDKMVADNFCDVICTPNKINLSKLMGFLNQESEDAHILNIMIEEILMMLMRGYVEDTNHLVDYRHVLNFMREYVFKFALGDMLMQCVNQKTSYNALELRNYINGRALSSRTVSAIDYERWFWIQRNCSEEFVLHNIIKDKGPDDLSLPCSFCSSISSLPMDYPSEKIELCKEIDETKQELIESCIHTIIMKEVFVVLLKEYIIQLHHQIEEHVLCSFMTVDILNLILAPVLMDLHDKYNCSGIGHFVLENLYLTFLIEAVESMHPVDVNGSSTMCKPENKYNSAGKLLPISGNHEAEEKMLDDEICEEILTSLLKLIIRKHMIDEYGIGPLDSGKNSSPVSWKGADINNACILDMNIWYKKEDTLNELNVRLEKAFEQILRNREELRDLQSGLDIPKVDYKQDLRSKIKNNVDKTSFTSSDDESKTRRILESMVSSTVNLSQVFSDLEQIVHNKLRLVILRLDELKRLVDPLADQAKSLGNHQVVYRRAFISRCCNLQRAEVEVDLLADEVDVLLGLLEKVYLVLDHHSPVLQHYTGVMDIMKLIRRELTKEVTTV